MSAKRARVATVLRVRRVQELQAAGAMAAAAAYATEAEAALAGLRLRYEEDRPVDHRDGLVPERLRDHTTRAMHARAIQRGRERVKEAVATVDLRRMELVERTQAVKAMERLDERIAADEDLDARRAEHRELDERNISVAARKDRR